MSPTIYVQDASGRKFFEKVVSNGSFRSEVRKMCKAARASAEVDIKTACAYVDGVSLGPLFVDGAIEAGASGARVH